MERLTVPDEPIEGGMRRAIIDARAVRAEAMKIYWALKKYEDTGLTPQEIIDGKMLTGWIPVEERLPEEPNAGAIEMEDLQEYIAMIEGAELPTVLLYIGNGAWCTAGVFYKVVAWMPLPEPYRPEE